MRRFMVLLALVAIMAPVSMDLTAAGNEPAPLKLEKECVVFGRILGSHMIDHGTCVRSRVRTTDDGTDQGI